MLELEPEPVPVPEPEPVLVPEPVLAPVLVELALEPALVRLVPERLVVFDFGLTQFRFVVQSIVLVAVN